MTYFDDTRAFGPAFVRRGDHVRIERIWTGGGRCRRHKNAASRRLLPVSFEKNAIPIVGRTIDEGVDGQAIRVEQQLGRRESPKVLGDRIVNARIGMTVKQRKGLREFAGNGRTPMDHPPLILGVPEKLRGPNELGLGLVFHGWDDPLLAPLDQVF